MFYIGRYMFRSVLFFLLMISNGVIYGQQLVVDEAETSEYRGFQLEAWLGTEESWILPVFSPVGRLELVAGAVITDDETHAVTEAKYMFRAPANNRAGFGLVAGTLIAPFGEFYSYIPVTFPLLDERAVLHGNLGYMLERHDEQHGDHTHTRDDHLLTWGVRADIAAFGPVSLLGELFGENSDRPDFQVGFRLELLPDLLEMDFTYGNSFSRQSSGLGFIVGVAWTPPPLR